MFDVWNLPAPGTPPSGPVWPTRPTTSTSPSTPAAGPEDPPARSGTTPAWPALLVAALDEVDCGIALVCADGEVLHLNRRARQALRADAPLQVLAGTLRTARAQDLLRLHTTLHDATKRGLRRMLSVGDTPSRMVCALVPVAPGMAALLLGRSDSGTMLSIECLAQLFGLTAAEARVLRALSRGVPPVDIAREHGVKLATVRTQIGALRHKTDTPTITALVRLVAGLPPMASALQGH
jgi:DNA-binding CsgD family transcriptional regulator